MNKRYVSLDVLRGLTITLMCIVNNPGTWGKIFPPLRHAGWEGCTPTDLVFPFFVFCAGCAMAFSLRKYEDAGAKAYLHVLKRGALIFLAGVLLALYPFFPVSPHDETASFWQNFGWWLGHKRVFGVLQRIGMAYAIAGCLVLWLRKPGRVLTAVGVLCAAYTAVLLLFGTDPGPFTLEGNVSVRIDRWLVGSDHCYHGYSGTDFDPEGPLGAVTTACTCLLGWLAGWLVRRDGVTEATVNRLFAGGMTSLALAMVLSIWIPISKPLWSASYVFYAGGWALLCLALLSWLVDLRGHEKAFVPMRAMGTNPLVAFLASGIIAKSYVFFGFSPSKYFGTNEYTSLLYALLFAGVIFCIQWVLYKKKIVIRL